MGAVSKRQKEIREKERKQLTGIEGKKLYLEALQLILRHQLLWLVREKGHREELETVVHDLWDLRVRAFGSIAPEENTGDGNLEVFSSQPVTDDSGDDDAQLFPTKSLTWDPDRGPDWPMPRMVETLALCYLGCLLLRIPTRIGQFSKWANGGHLPYRRIVRIPIILPWVQSSSGADTAWCSTMSCRRRCKTVCPRRIRGYSRSLLTHRWTRVNFMVL